MTDPTPVVAPYVQTYAQHEPYLTRDEYLTSPNAVSVANLVAAKSAEVNLMALDQILVAASGWADQLCNQVLAATVEVQAGRPRRQADGTIKIVCPFEPVIQVNGFAIGTGPDAAVPVTTLAGVQVDRKVVTIPATLIGSAGNYTELTYVAGYANAYLTAAAAAGDTTLAVDSTLGVVAGMSLTIADPATAATEVITVGSVTGTTITTVVPIRNAHAAGVNVSALPPSVKQAIVFLATSLIKRRGAAPIVVGTIGGAPQQQPSYPSGGAEEAQATKMLATFGRVI